MICYWSSRSGNTKRFVDKLDMDCQTVENAPSSRFVIITPTVGDGECPQPVSDYLERYGSMCVGSIVGGNRNFGDRFAGAAKVIRDRFGIPTLYRFEMAGTPTDVKICREGIAKCLK